MKTKIKLQKALACAAALLVFAAAMFISGALGKRKSAEAAEQASAQLREGICVPVIMYHSIYPETEGSRYIVTPSQLESDLSYLKRNGFTAIFCDDIISYRNGEKKLPDKPVLLTFDDGCYNFLTYALPLLEKYHMRCTLSVVGRFVEAADEGTDPDPKYSYLSTNDLKEVLASERVELANHSFDMHSLDERQGASQMASESYKEYRRAIFNDVFKAQRMFRENLGVRPGVYTYPYGLTCASGKMLLEMCGFELLLGCEEKLNYITQGEELLTLGRFNREPDIPTEDFMKRIEP